MMTFITFAAGAGASSNLTSSPTNTAQAIIFIQPRFRFSHSCAKQPNLVTLCHSLISAPKFHPNPWNTHLLFDSQFLFFEKLDSIL
mmetsp:Transcript_46141/g.96895  ORF Transcript_46141/g.96895 Transcript_46141/m.96895 type:complete len:86 (+) Transcript_46141:637-894(+)